MIAAAGAPPARSVRWGGREVPVVLPTWRDPRLHLAAIIVSLQVLGQSVLRFELSIAQILVSVLTCALLEVGITLWRRKALIWPASGMLTGNGVAFLLRVPGTRYGQWWSLHGAGYFALAGAISLLSKYLIRLPAREGRPGRHLFNPSNFGLVVVLVAFGTRVVNPQDLWWGPMSPGLGLTLAVIVVGGLTIAGRLRMLGLVASFWLTFVAGTGIVAAGGHCMTARWHVSPLCGTSFWWVLALSPEILVFMFFMITDPKTTPEGRRARIAYGAAVGFLAALLVAPAGTEFWTKVGVLAALGLVCGLRPVAGRLTRRWTSVAARAWRGPDRVPPGRRGVRPVVLGAAAVAVGVALLVAGGVPARPAAALPLPARGLPVAPAITPGVLPPVSIDPAVTRIDAGVTAVVAQQMGESLAGDLTRGAQALATRNPGLAAQAGTSGGSWLKDLLRQIRVGPTGPIPDYSFTTLRVVRVTNPLRPQDAAQLGIAARGTRRVETTSAAFQATFVLAPAGDTYLIAAERPGP